MMDATSIIAEMDKKTNDEKEMLRLAFRQFNGFNGNDETYVPIYVTDEVVARMKSEDCDYCRSIGFHSPYKLDGIDMVAVRFDDVAEYDSAYKRWKIPYTKCRQVIGELCKFNLKSKDAKSEFVGEIGKKVKVFVKLDESRTVRSKSDFGDFCQLIFSDGNGNKFAWFQRVYTIDTVRGFINQYGENGYVNLEGFVKGHTIFRSVKSTTLKMCVMSGVTGVRITTYANELIKKGVSE